MRILPLFRSLRIGVPIKCAKMKHCDSKKMGIVNGNLKISGEEISEDLKKNHIGIKMLVFALLVITSLAGAGEAATSLFNSGGGSWQYYRDITLAEKSGNNLTDYQVLVQLAGSNFPTTRPDGADIRFTDAAGNVLSYWPEIWDYSGKSASIWVKVPNIPANGNTNIKMYYGNPNANSVSSGDNTFEIFDDFEGGTIKRIWTVLPGNGTISQGGGVLSFSYEGSQYNDWWWWGRPEKVLKLNNLPTGNFHAQIKMNSYTVNDATHAGIAVYGSDTEAYFWGMELGTVILQKVGSENLHKEPSSGFPLYLAIRRMGSSYSFYLSNNGSTWIQGGGYYNDIPLNNIVLFGKEWGIKDLKFSMDNFLVRKYASPEPTIYIGPEIPNSGNISITSMPSGAEVFVDGVSKGAANPTINISNISPGSHILKCNLSGHPDYNTNVTVVVEGVTTIICDFNKTVLLVNVTSETMSIKPGESSLIKVVVTDNNGSPVPKANVTMTSTDKGIFSNASGVTDDKGIFVTYFTAKSTAEGDTVINVLVSKEGFSNSTGKTKLKISIITLWLTIAALAILILASLGLFLWTRNNLRLIPERTSISCDGKSTLPIKVQFSNTFGKIRKQDKDREVEMETTSGKIQNVIIPAGKEFIEATLISSNECGPVTVTAKSGKQKAEVQVRFEEEKNQQQIRNCPKCGATALKEDTFCGNCGKPFEVLL